VLKLSSVKWIDMKNKGNTAIQTLRSQSGSQKVSQVESVAFSGKRGASAQSNSTEAGPTASNQRSHGTAFSKSRKSRNRKGGKNRAVSSGASKYDTTAPAVGLKYTSVTGVAGSNKYDTDTPVPGLKYRNEQSESVRLIVRSNDLGALKARIVIQLGDSSLGHNVSTEKPTVAGNTTSEANLLTKSGATNKKKWKQGSGANSQRPLKSNFKSQRKSFGRNINNKQGYRSPNSEFGNSIPVRSYTPFTEAQKRNFSRLLKETLYDC
jgi:hypothetical protein